MVSKKDLYQRSLYKQRNKARKTLTRVAEALLGYSIAPNHFCELSGRYEYKNKGMDVFLDSLNKLRCNQSLKKDIVAL